MRKTILFILDFWKNLGPKTKRILTIVIFLIISIMMTIFGILAPISPQLIDDLGKGLEDTQTIISNLPAVQQVSFIFGNNFMICLMGFVPIIGPIFESYVLYSTGVTITAYVSYTNIQINPILVFASLLILPFTWLEFLAYSLAISESFWLTWRLIKRKGKKEIKNSCLIISICAAILLVAAIIEVAMILYIESLG
ncbi:MAG: stage II sporulation protein M [Candidatus Bathyarchaeota archaeon]